MPGIHLELPLKKEQDKVLFCLLLGVKLHNGDSHVCLLIIKIQLALMSPIYLAFVSSIELYLSLLPT